MQMTLNRLAYVSLAGVGTKYSVKYYLYLFAWALLLPLIFFSPLLTSSHPEYLFSGDTQILYFPQFVQGYFLSHRGIYTGIDFLTNNASSGYFLRPNIPVYYPIYQLLHLFSFSSLSGLAKAFVWVWYIQAVLAFYFSLLLGLRFFGLHFLAAMVLATAYTFAITIGGMTIPVFYYTSSLFPLILFVSLSAVSHSIGLRSILYSCAFVLMFLSGYVPLAVHAVAICLIFAMLYRWYILRVEGVVFVWRDFFALFAPVCLGGLVVLPLYLAIVSYHKLVPGVPDGVWVAAHHMSYGIQEFLGLWSKSFLPPSSESPHLAFGLVSLLILLITFFARNKLKISPVHGTLLGVCAAIVVFHLFLACGQLSGLPDLFYYTVPGLGKMHIYGRYLLVASFFFFLSMSLLLQMLAGVSEKLPLAVWLMVLIGLIVLVFAYSSYQETSKFVDISRLIIELSMLVVVVFALASKQKIFTYLSVLFAYFSLSAMAFNITLGSVNPERLPAYRLTVSNVDERNEKFLNFVRSNSHKNLIKFADLTASIEKLKGVSLNYPWLVQNQIKLANYFGYEPHTSIDREYNLRFPWFGVVDFNWLLRTGADYVVFDAASQSKYEKQLAIWLDPTVPVLDLGEGYKVAKLKDAAGLISELPSKKIGDIDNGLVRTMTESGGVIKSRVDTDYASFIHLDIETTGVTNLQFDMFANKLMELRLNGQVINPAGRSAFVQDNLLQVGLPVGKNKISYEYKNRLHSVFMWIYAGYWLLVCLVLMIYLFRYLNFFKAKGRNLAKEQQA